jgi:hypothetical protein
MPVLRFKAAELKRCIDHARAATSWEMGYEDMTDEQFREIGLPPPEQRQPRGPCLLFVHDRGVYLMSNGIPRDLTDNGRSSYVVYAEHCHPHDDEDYYENSRDLVGGDDFVETIHIPRSWDDACDQFETFEIVMNDNVIDCGFVDPIVPVTN